VGSGHGYKGVVTSRSYRLGWRDGGFSFRICARACVCSVNV
jgi:hypothetical protein